MNRDLKQLETLFLTDPEGGRMEISSDLRDAGNGDNSMQFCVRNPETGRRFSVTFGISELMPEAANDAAPLTREAATVPLTDAQIKRMVDRFLGWRLPENFSPDAGISFKKTYNEHLPSGPMKHEPTGTNLFDAVQPEAMIRYLLAASPAADSKTLPRESEGALSVIREMIVVATSEDGDPDEWSIDNRAQIDKWQSRLQEAIAITAQPVADDTGATHVNLEGLRERLLTPREIVRDENGWLYHPQYPICDEGTRADKFLEAFGIETQFVGMESDSPDFAERWHEEGLCDCSEWTPTPPEGDGWLLLEIYDTEDGPYAMFGRDFYAAERARKRAHTLRLSEEVRRRRLAASGVVKGNAK